MTTHLRLRRTIAAIMSVSVIAGCESVLDVKPETFSGTTNYYQTPDQMDRAIFGAYSTLQPLYGAGATGPMWLLAEMRADNTTYEQNQTDRSQVLTESVDDFMTTADNTGVSNMWNTSYGGILQTNVILDRIGGVTYTDQVAKDRIIAEAKWLRALYYYNLVRVFGDLPLRLHETQTYEGAFTQQRAPVDSIYSVIIAALKDKYYGLRIKAIRALNMKNDDIQKAALPVLTSLAQSDENTLVRAAAINVLAKLKSRDNLTMFKQGLKSESYAVQGAALNGIDLLDPAQALDVAKGFEKDNRGALTTAIVGVYAENGKSAQWPFVYKQFTDGDINGKFMLVRKVAQMIGTVDSPADAQQGITAIKEMGIKYKIYNGVAPFIAGLLNNIKEQRTKLKDDASAKAAEDAAKAVSEAKDKDAK